MRVLYCRKFCAIMRLQNVSIHSYLKNTPQNFVLRRLGPGPNLGLSRAVGHVHLGPFQLQPLALRGLKS